MDKIKYNTDTSFARIAAGESSCWKIFETEHSIAMLSGLSLARGHSILLAKKSWSTILDAPADQYALFMGDLPVLVKAVQTAVGADGISILQNNGQAANQGVMHMHVHVLPRYNKEPSNPLSNASGGQLLDSDQAQPLLAAIKKQLPSWLCGWSLFVDSEDDTTNVGNLLANVIQPGDVITLSGELGAGKTCIARGIIRSFFHNVTLDVPSPSFLLCLSYAPDHADYNESNDDMNENANRMTPCKRSLSSEDTEDATRTRNIRIPTIHHMDPFRLRNKDYGKMAALIDLERAFRDDVTIIEWPERLGSSILASATNRLEIRIDGVGPQGQGRWISFKGLGDRWHTLVAQWSQQTAITPPVGAISYRAKNAEAPSLSSSHANASANSSSQGHPVAPLPNLPADRTSWIVLGIDTSCDDTGAAVVRGDGTILGEELASQTGLHQEFGGVKPDVAQSAHKKAINSTVESALAKAGIEPSQLTAVAVTVGPGLALCLEVGVRKALEISSKFSLPLVRIHHMEAHALVTRLPRDGLTPFEFPVLTLLVSGGHNMLVLSKGVGNHIIVGSTIDDSVGEAFDKTARLLGIDAIPGGPALERMAKNGNAAAYASRITVPLSQSRHTELRTGCDFSFAGLKTSVQSLVKAEEGRIQTQVPEEERGKATEEMRANIAATFQKVSVTHLTERTKRAIARIREHDEIKCLVVAGGVAANTQVRVGMEAVANEAGIPLVCPPIRLCTDNGVMVAWAAVERMMMNLYDRAPTAENYEKHVEVLPRWPIGPRDPRSIMKPGC